MKKTINLLVELVPRDSSNNIHTCMCSFTVPEDVTPDMVQSHFFAAFFPHKILADLFEDEPTEAVHCALQDVERELNAQCFLLNADCSARFII